MSDLTQLFIQKSEDELIDILKKQICKGDISGSEIEEAPDKLKIVSESSLPTIIAITEKQLKNAKQEYKIIKKDDLPPYILSRIENKWREYEKSLGVFKKEKKNVEKSIPKVKKVCKDLQPFIDSFREYCSIRKYSYEDIAEILVKKTIKEIKDITKSDIEDKIESYVPLDIWSKLEKIYNNSQDILLKKYSQELIKRTGPEFLERLKLSGNYQKKIVSTIRDYDENTANTIKKMIYDLAEKQGPISGQDIFNLYINPEFVRSSQKEFKEDYTQEKERIDGEIFGKKQYLESQTEKLKGAAEDSIRAGKGEHANWVKDCLEKIEDNMKKEMEEKKKEMEEKTKQYEILNKGINRLLPEFDYIFEYNTINSIYNENINKLKAEKSSFDSEFKNLINTTRGKLEFNEFYKSSIDSIIDKIGQNRTTYKI